jgi:hypothetical protein
LELAEISLVAVAVVLEMLLKEVAVQVAAVLVEKVAVAEKYLMLSAVLLILVQVAVAVGLVHQEQVILAVMVVLDSL